MRDDFHDFYREKILPYEGGYVWDPLDHGGETNLGVTAATWAGWIGHWPSTEEMKALTPQQVEPMYRARFWLACRGPELPRCLAIPVVDHCCGNPRKGAILLQRLVGATPDGVIGPQTVAAAREYAASRDAASACNAYRDARLNEYARIVANDPPQQRFIKGWNRRAAETCEWVKARLGDA